MVLSIKCYAGSSLSNIESLPEGTWAAVVLGELAFCPGIQGTDIQDICGDICTEPELHLHVIL